MKTNIYIASCSFGKDSIATILLAIENGEPLDRIVFAEVMFDHKRGVSGEIPEHIEWVYLIAIPKLEQMGINIDVVKADIDYLYCFNHIPNGKYKGKQAGFPIGGKCVINRECKLKPIKKYYRQFREKYNIIQYVGIAVDEPKRIARLQKNQISLLAKYNYTEKMAMELCQKYNLVSPIYATGTRGGCWFCPNAKLKYFAELRQKYPSLWREIVKLSNKTNLISKGFKYGKTVAEVEQELNKIDLNNKLQLKLELQ